MSFHFVVFASFWISKSKLQHVNQFELEKSKKKTFIETTFPHTNICLNKNVFAQNKIGWTPELLECKFDRINQWRFGKSTQSKNRMQICTQPYCSNIFICLLLFSPSNWRFLNKGVYINIYSVPHLSLPQHVFDKIILCFRRKYINKRM